MKNLFKITIFLLLSLLLANCTPILKDPHGSEKKRIKHHNNVNLATKDIVEQYTPVTKHELFPLLQKAGLQFPPKEITLIALKEESRLELWARDNHVWHHIKNYPIKAKSGVPGPKLREHDAQIPEGVYRIVMLNPFSALHLSMKLDYPNAFDRYHAMLDHRNHLGGDIFIHGKTLSVGCIAIGDAAIEELFVLVADTGISHVKVIIAPNDLRVKPALAVKKPEIPWVSALDTELSVALQPFGQTSLAKA
jgi:murein L,D-transpeptidase YafK